MLLPIDFARCPPSTPQSVVSRPYCPPSRFSPLIFLYVHPDHTLPTSDHIDSDNRPHSRLLRPLSLSLSQKIAKLNRSWVCTGVSYNPFSLAVADSRDRLKVSRVVDIPPGRPQGVNYLIRENNRKAGYPDPRPVKTLRRTIALEDDTTKRSPPTHIRRRRPSEPILIVTLGIGHPWIITGTRRLSTPPRSQRSLLHT